MLLLQFWGTLCKRSQGYRFIPLFPQQSPSSSPWHLQPHYLPFVFASQPVRLSLLLQLFLGQCTRAIQLERAAEIFFSPCVVKLTFSGRCQCSTSSCSLILGCKSLTEFSNRLLKGKSCSRLGPGYRLTAIWFFIFPVGKAILLSCHFSLLIPGAAFLSFALVFCFKIKSEEEILLGEFCEFARWTFLKCRREGNTERIKHRPVLRRRYGRKSRKFNPLWQTMVSKAERKFFQTY